MFEAYAAPEFADEYFSSTGNAKWPKTPAVVEPSDPQQTPDSREHDAMSAKKKAALARASMWLDAIAYGKWKGEKTERDQPLAWPRAGVVVEEYEIPDDETPNNVRFACCEAALRIIRGADVSPDLQRGGAIKREKIGPLDTEFFDGAPVETRYTVIEELLVGLLKKPLFEKHSASGRALAVHMERA